MNNPNEQGVGPDINHQRRNSAWNGASIASNMKDILPDYSLQMVTCSEETQAHTGQEECPQLTWNASNCENWKSGWDVTIFGLLPDMTTYIFFNDYVEISDEKCNEIVSEGIGEDF